MHAKSSGHAAMTVPPPTPPDTADGFARMTYEQRADLHTRDTELYRRLAAAQPTAVPS
ncbi:MAG: hypothetical protein ACR2KO_06035 [Geodermatophilaceae bacterium]